MTILGDFDLKVKELQKTKERLTKSKYVGFDYVSSETGVDPRSLTPTNTSTEGYIRGALLHPSVQTLVLELALKECTEEIEYVKDNIAKVIGVLK